MQWSNLNAIDIHCGFVTQKPILWYDIIHISPPLHSFTNSRRKKSPFSSALHKPLILTKGDSSKTNFLFYQVRFSLSLPFSVIFFYFSCFTLSLSLSLSLLCWIKQIAPLCFFNLSFCSVLKPHNPTHSPSPWSFALS